MHDANKVWWYDFVQITQQLFERSNVLPEDIAWIGVSALYAAILPLDEGVGKASYTHLNKKAAALELGSDDLVVLPYFSGERTPINDESAQGTIVDLTMSQTKFHVYLAILKRIGYGFRHHFKTMEAVGVPIDRVLAIGGGGAQSNL